MAQLWGNVVSLDKTVWPGQQCIFNFSLVPQACVSWAIGEALTGPEQLGWDVRICDMKGCLDLESVTTHLFNLPSLE